MAETWLSSKLYINDGSGGERLVHYETDTKNIVDFEQAVNEIINNAFEGTVLRGTTTLENLHVTGTSQLDGDVTCNSDLSVHGTINISNGYGTIDANNEYVRLSSKSGSYIDLKRSGGWEIVSKNGDNVYSTLSASSNGDLTYDGNVTIDKNLKVNGTVSSPINLPYATITSNNTSTVIKTTTGALIDIPNVANREIQLKTSNDHTFALTGDGKITVDGEEVASKEIILNSVYPVGFVYITLTDVNPGTILGVGTWEKIGQGLQLAIAGSAKDSNNTNHTFAAGVNAGEWSHAITLSEMPSHDHKVSCSDDINKQGDLKGKSGHTHDKGTYRIKGRIGAIGEEDTNYTTPPFYQDGKGGVGDDDGWDYFVYMDTNLGGWTGRSGRDGYHTHTVTIGKQGGGNKTTMINPSFAIYLWKRIS